MRPVVHLPTAPVGAGCQLQQRLLPCKIAQQHTSAGWAHCCSYQMSATCSALYRNNAACGWRHCTRSLGHALQVVRQRCCLHLLRAERLLLRGVKLHHLLPAVPLPAALSRMSRSAGRCSAAAAGPGQLIVPCWPAGRQRCRSRPRSGCWAVWFSAGAQLCPCRTGAARHH